MLIQTDTEHFGISLSKWINIPCERCVISMNYHCFWNKFKFNRKLVSQLFDSTALPVDFELGMCVCNVYRLIVVELSVSIFSRRSELCTKSCSIFLCIANLSFPWIYNKRTYYECKNFCLLSYPFRITCRHKAKTILLGWQILKQIFSFWWQICCIFLRVLSPV